jgi:hypothetical protein
MELVAYLNFNFNFKFFSVNPVQLSLRKLSMLGDISSASATSADMCDDIIYVGSGPMEMNIEEESHLAISGV